MANMSFEVKLQAVSLKFTVTLKFPLNMNDLLVIAADFLSDCFLKYVQSEFIVVNIKEI